MVKNLIIFLGIDENLARKIAGFFNDCNCVKTAAPEEVKNLVKAKNFMHYAVLINQVEGGFIHEFPNNKVILDPSKEDCVKNAVSQIKWIFSNFGKDYPMTDNTFFISDNHFCHSNIIKYCERPWNSGKDAAGDLIVAPEDVERMNEEMIKRWNSVVGKNDTVWNLGDFCLGGKDSVKRIVSRLNGRINLVLGNHDRQKLKFYYEAGFNRVYDRPVVINEFFILSHAPLEWVKNPMFNIFGHVHTSSIYNTWSMNGCCVCVERHDYTPVSWKTIRDNIVKLESGQK